MRYSDRRGEWMQTYTGQAFYPNDPRIEDINHTDIAHALSMICRYGGHAQKFYSVAEHSVLLSWVVPPEHQRWALMHDAAEAYVGDMIRPIKRMIADFAPMENKVLTAIAYKYQLPWQGSKLFPEEVEQADYRILLDERAQILGKQPQPWAASLESLEPFGLNIQGLHPDRARMLFLNRMAELELI